MKKLIRQGHADLFPLPTMIVVSGKGKEETLDTLAWAAPINLEPQMIMIAIRKTVQSCNNIMKTKEFSINIPSIDQLDKVDYIVRTHGSVEDKMKISGFNYMDGKMINCKLIAESIISMECKVKQLIDINGTHMIFFAEVIKNYYNEKIVKSFEEDDLNYAVSLENIDPIAYVMGEYWSLGKKEGTRSI